MTSHTTRLYQVNYVFFISKSSTNTPLNLQAPIRFACLRDESNNSLLKAFRLVLVLGNISEVIDYSVRSQSITFSNVSRR